MVRFPFPKAIVFDLEFTDPVICKALGAVPEIIEVGAILVEADLSAVTMYDSLVRPNHLSRLGSSEEITGLTAALLSTAESWTAVGAEFAKFCGRTPLICWGDRDPGILEHAYLTNCPVKRPIFDACSMASVFSGLYGFDFGSYGLRAAAERMGVTYNAPHRALNDARITLKILQELFSYENDCAFVEGV